MKHFTMQNTDWKFSQEQLDAMNKSLSNKLEENGVNEDDDTMVKHYAEQILDRNQVAE